MKYVHLALHITQRFRSTNHMKTLNQAVVAILGSFSGLLFAISCLFGVLFHLRTCLWLPICAGGLVGMVLSLRHVFCLRNAERGTTVSTNITRNYNMLLASTILPIGPIVTVLLLWKYLSQFPWPYIVLLFFLFALIQIFCVIVILSAEHLFIVHADNTRHVSNGMDTRTPGN